MNISQAMVLACGSIPLVTDIMERIIIGCGHIIEYGAPHGEKRRDGTNEENRDHINFDAHMSLIKCIFHRSL
jgi:hypothetical protein